MIVRTNIEYSNHSKIAKFLTLTYDEKNKPEIIQKKEIQDFLKRLRIQLSRYTDIKNIKYIFCGEYGKLRNRPHYHAIIFGLPEIINYKQKQYPTYKLIYECWGKGYIQYEKLRQIEAISYVLKYVMKDKYEKLLGKTIDKKSWVLLSKNYGKLNSTQMLTFRRKIRKAINNKNTLTVDNITIKINNSTYAIPRYYKKQLSSIEQQALSAINRKYIDSNDIKNIQSEYAILLKKIIQKINK